jgi:hypothetical protein
LGLQKDMPAQYIYEPWTAPLSVQKQANCIIGACVFGDVSIGSSPVFGG